MDTAQKMAGEQLANIEIIKFMMLDLWGEFLLAAKDPGQLALRHRAKQLQVLQSAVDATPDSFIRQAALSHAEQNWSQIFDRLRAEGVVTDPPGDRARR